MARNEVHAELLMGRPVRDPTGKVIGRIEEITAVERDGAMLVEQFHLGPHALLERLSASFLSFPLLRLLGRRPAIVKLDWDELDLSDLTHLRIKAKSRTRAA
jgi:hypothetical protein